MEYDNFIEFITVSLGGDIVSWTGNERDPLIVEASFPDMKFRSCCFYKALMMFIAVAPGNQIAVRKYGTIDWKLITVPSGYWSSVSASRTLVVMTATDGKMIVSKDLKTWFNIENPSMLKISCLANNLTENLWDYRQPFFIAAGDGSNNPDGSIIGSITEHAAELGGRRYEVVSSVKGE